MGSRKPPGLSVIGAVNTKTHDNIQINGDNQNNIHMYSELKFLKPNIKFSSLQVTTDYNIRQILILKRETP